MLDLLLLPAVILTLVFAYIPMSGLVIAFQDFKPWLGFAKSSWIGLEHFEYLFSTKENMQVIWNTLIIAGMKVVGGLIAPLVFALLLNEVRKAAFKRTVQTFDEVRHRASGRSTRTSTSPQPKPPKRSATSRSGSPSTSCFPSTCAARHAPARTTHRSRRRRRSDACSYLGFLAGRFPSLRLGTHVYNIGLRHPFVVWRAVQTLDIVSGGRFRSDRRELAGGEWVTAGLDFRAEVVVSTKR